MTTDITKWALNDIHVEFGRVAALHGREAAWRSEAGKAWLEIMGVRPIKPATTEQSTGLDIEALWYDAARDAGEDPIDTRHRFAALIIDRAASIAERMGLDAQSDEAKRLAVEIGAAIRAEAG